MAEMIRGECNISYKVRAKCDVRGLFTFPVGRGLA